jgi:hypothetical protein
LSPDGRWLAYFAAPQLVRVPVDGGTPEPIVGDLRGAVRGFHWDDDRLVYADQDGIFEVAAMGGEPPVRLITAGEGEYFANPQRLPGRDALLFSVAKGTLPSDWDAGDIVVHSFVSGERTPVVRRARDARYLRSGHIVYAQGTALYAAAFDLDRLEVTGPALRMVDDGIVRAESGQGDSAQYVVSDTGSLVYLESPPGAAPSNARKRSLVWVDRTGLAQPIDVPPDNYSSARISPDGRRAVLVVGGTGESQRPDLWIFDLTTGNQRRQLTSGMSAEGPVWSNDSTRIYFRSSPAASSTFYAIDADSGQRQLISEGAAEFSIAFPSALTPDGETLLLMNFRENARRSIAALGVGASREFSLVLQDASSPALSSDGAWMAYVESSTGNVRIATYPDVARPKYTIAAGNLPAFSGNGRELYFVDGDSLRAQSLEYEGDVLRTAGAPRELFSGPYRFNMLGRAWDVHPGDGRFLLLLDAAGDNDTSSPPERQRIHFVVNWVEELQRRLAAE